MSNKEKKRINAFISKENYEGIDKVINNNELISMRLSKGAILDLALSNLFKTLEFESLESIAIQYLEKGDA